MLRSLLRTIHIDVLDRGRFNKMHTLGVAKPMLAAASPRQRTERHCHSSEVKDACDKSGAPIELFAPVAGRSLRSVSARVCVCVCV